MEEEMRTAAAELRFEEAALLRDELVELRMSATAPPATELPGALTAGEVATESPDSGRGAG